MTIQADDLQPGMWILIRSRELADAMVHPHVIQCGVPLYVLAVDLPFVVLSTDGGGTFGMDIRCCELQRCRESYVKAWQSGKPAPIPDVEQPGNCPRCGKPLRTGRPIIGTWRPYCNQCGFQGDPAFADS